MAGMLAMNRHDLPRLCRQPGIVRLHGHRGMRGVMAENTLAGFKAAFDLSVQIIELDVMATADDIVVITHDPRLAAHGTRDLAGRWLAADGPAIRSLNYAELAGYDVGASNPASAYGQRWPDQQAHDHQPVPRLADLFALMNSPGKEACWANIEIKSSPLTPHLFAPPDEIARLVTTDILRAGMKDRVLVQSFDWRVLHALKAIAPDLPRSYLSYQPPDGAASDINIYQDSPWMDGLGMDGLGMDGLAMDVPDRADRANSLPDLIAAAGGVHWAPWYLDVTREQIERARAAGLVISVWTVNEPEDINRMIDIGADGIITDYPQRVQQLLLARGWHWIGPDEN